MSKTCPELDGLAVLQYQTRKFQVFAFLLTFLVQMFLLRELTLEAAKASPTPTHPFDESLFPGYQTIFWLNLALTLLAMTRLCRSFLGIAYSLVLGVTLTVALLVFGGSLLGRVFGYYPTGVAATLATTASFSLIEQMRSGFLKFDKRLSESWDLEVEPPRNSVFKSIAALGLSLTGLYILAIPMRGYFFWDYVGQEGRFAMQQALAFSSFPPGSFSYADLPLTYHFGFDGLVSGISILGGLALDRSNVYVGLVLILLNFFSILLFVRTVLQKTSPAPASISLTLLTALAALFSGGLPFYFGTVDLNHVFAGVFQGIDLRGLWILPPYSSFMFQRAFSIGVPILFCAVAVDVRCEGTTGRERLKRYLILSLLLIGLSISNTTLTVSLIVYYSIKGALRTLQLIAQRRIFKPSVWSLTMCGPFQISILFGGLLLFNGFFSNVISKDANGPTSVDGFGLGICGHTASCREWLLWFILSFGFTSLGFVVLRKSREALILAASGLTVGFFLDFAGSPDEVKFSVVPRMILAMGLVAAVSSFTRLWSALSRTPVIVATLAVIMVSSLVFLGPLVRDSPVVRPFPIARYQSVESVSSPNVLVVDFAKRLEGRSGFVCSPSLVNYCGTYGGLLQFNQDVISKQLFGEDSQRNLDKPLTSSVYIEMGFHYLITSEADLQWWSFSEQLIYANLGSLLFEDDGIRLVKLVPA